MAARLAPKKYGDHISHDVKGPGPNFQPAILITVDGQPHDEFARQLAYDEDGGSPYFFGASLAAAHLRASTRSRERWMFS